VQVQGGWARVMEVAAGDAPPRFDLHCFLRAPIIGVSRTRAASATYPSRLRGGGGKGPPDSAGVPPGLLCRALRRCRCCCLHPQNQHTHKMEQVR
jgi:hypothetical protein